MDQSRRKVPRVPSFVTLSQTLIVFLCAGVAPVEVCGQQFELRHLKYSGTLSAADTPADSDDVLRRFDVELLVSVEDAVFRVDDDRRHGVPWPDSFGRTGSGIPDRSNEPHLVYEYDSVPYVIGLPLLVVALPDSIEPDLEWSHRGWMFHAVESTTADGQTVWQLDATEPRGRRQTMLVDADSGLLRSAEADVFMGQGDPFRLLLKRTADTRLNAEVSERVRRLQNELLSVQGQLNRRPDGFQRELSDRQIEAVAGRLDELEVLAADTPWKPLLDWIADDLVQQLQRQSMAADRAEKLLGTKIPDFKLTVAGGGSVAASDLSGQVVVLHFWDYRDSPLSEPYGQTGYLEFLFNQKKSANVRVVGISTNPELTSDETRPRGLRAVRKLAEFMNLTYPIGFDDGSLLRALGDPRESRGQLPLWVILSADGTIRHYHAGPYEVDASRGLSELEAVLGELTRGSP